jgi:hypothetical protein
MALITGLFVDKFPGKFLCTFWALALERCDIRPGHRMLAYQANMSFQAALFAE